MKGIRRKPGKNFGGAKKVGRKAGKSEEKSGRDKEFIATWKNQRITGDSAGKSEGKFCFNFSRSAEVRKSRKNQGITKEAREKSWRSKKVWKKAGKSKGGPGRIRKARRKPKEKS